MNTDKTTSSSLWQNLGFKDETEFNEWKATPSGKIYEALDKLADTERKSLSLKGRGSRVELFSLDGQVAKIYKALVGGTTAEDDGELNAYYESWESIHYPWWQEALRTSNSRMTPLPFPLFRVAQDLGIKNWQEFFKPDEIIKKFELNKKQHQRGTPGYVALEKAIISVMQKCLNPGLNPHYRIEEQTYLPRLVPLTNDAKSSLVEENDVYKEAKNTIKENLKPLEEGYKALQKAQR